MAKHERKCEHCGEWNDVQLISCTSCDKDFDRVFRDDMEKLKKKVVFDIPLIKIKESDSAPIKFMKRIVQVHQLVFYAIIAFLVYLSTSLAH